MNTRKIFGKYKRQIIRAVRKRRGSLQRAGKAAVLGVAIAAVAAGLFQVSSNMNKKSVYAAAGDHAVMLTEQDVPTGLAGVISGVGVTEPSGEPVKRIGTSGEAVIVGQRTFRKEEEPLCFDMSQSVEEAAAVMNDTFVSSARQASMMSDTDYQTLLSIVEAEAGGEDIKGKVLVANVIMNRVRNAEFPDTITEVVWDQSGGAPQFSPTYDGRISTVTVSAETEEAVKMAMDGVDYSEGALFFVAKDQAEQHNVDWFESDLKHLFEHGVHDFYTWPDPEKAKLREP